MFPKRGDVWWIKLDPTIDSEIRKTRPCVVVSDDVFNRRRNTVVIIPISTSAAVSPPATVEVKGSRVQGVAVLEHIRGVSKLRFTTLYDQLSDENMERIEKSLKLFLDIR